MTWLEIPGFDGLRHPVAGCRDDGACQPPTPGDVVDAEIGINFISQVTQALPYSTGIVGGHPPVRIIPRPNRNDPCPCNSGRKYKKCCGGRA